jgi:hypothetical protein
MNDELEARLRAAFHSGPLPAAPSSLIDALERVPDRPIAAGSKTKSGSWPRVLAVAAVLLLGGALAISFGGSRPSPLPVPSSPPAAVASLAAESSASAPTRIIYSPQWTAEVPVSASNLDAIVAIVEKRINSTGVVGAQMTTDDEARVIVDLPAGVDPEPIRRLVGQTGRVGFVPLSDSLDPLPEVGSHLDQALFPNLIDGIRVPGAALVDDQLGQPALQLTLGEPGIDVFARYTSTHVGSRFAITIDDTVIAVPTIDSAIPDGIIQVTFGSPSAPDPAELERVATIVRIGPLPVPLVEVANGPLASASAPATPPTHCGPRVAVGGDQLECEPAIRAALAILPRDHPPIALVSFEHGCEDTPRQAVPDCATQMSGYVEVTYVDGSPPVRIAVGIGSQPSILPTLPTLAPRASAPG